MPWSRNDQWWNADFQKMQMASSPKKQKADLVQEEETESRASLMPPVPPSSLSVLQNTATAKNVEAAALGKLKPRDIDAASCLALSWRCHGARRRRKEMSSARKQNIAAAVLQDNTVDELTRETARLKETREIPDSTVDELTQLRRETARLKETIEIQEVKLIKQEEELRDLKSKCRKQKILADTFERILIGEMCCICQNSLPPRSCQKPLGEVCASCQDKVKIKNDEIQVGDGPKGPFLASYGFAKDFYEGLDVFSGKPLAAGEDEIMKAMEREFCGPEWGSQEIVTSNYGRIESEMSTEWEFACKPKKIQRERWNHGPVNPKEYWSCKPKKIQRERWNHLNTTPCSDVSETWKEYPGSEDDPFSGMRVGKPMLDCKGDQLEDDNDNLRFWPARVPISLEVLLKHPVAKRAHLIKPEVAGLRIYTGPGYSKLNGLLRMGKVEIAKLRQEGKNTFTVTISAINSGIRKLVLYTKFDQENSILYRGTGNMKMPDQVFQDKSFVEYGFSSATPRREVALQYSGNQHSAIFEIEAGQIDCGATLSWVSQYPGEGEHVILPLSNFQVVRVRQQTKRDILEETRKFLRNQSLVMQKRLLTETHRRAVLVIQSRMRASMLRHMPREQQQQEEVQRFLAQMVSSSRMRLYQRPPLPGVSGNADNACAALLNLSCNARLERRLEDFFLDVVPDQALEGPKILFEAYHHQRFLALPSVVSWCLHVPSKKNVPPLPRVRSRQASADMGPGKPPPQTACSDVTSQEARLNEMLRNMKIQDRIAIGLDLTSSRIEREVRQKEMDLQLRSEELEKACQKGGWANLLLKDPQIVNIYEMKLNINLNAQTLQQLRESRKACVLDIAKSLLQETREYLSGVNTTKDMQALELELLEPWREKVSDWYNNDIKNFKEAIDAIFETWKGQLSENADNLTAQAKQLSKNADNLTAQAQKTEDMDKALKLQNKAVLIAERALLIAERALSFPQKKADLKSFLADIVKRQSYQAHEEVGGNVTPALSVSTVLFEQAAALLKGQQEKETDTQTKESEVSKMSKTVSKVDEKVYILPIVLTALKIRRENFNTRQLSLEEGKELLQQIIETYSKTFPDCRLDLITFLHPEIIRSFDTTNEEALKSTGESVCRLVNILNEHGIQSFEGLVSYFEEDMTKVKMKLPQDLADKWKKVVQITKKSVVSELPAQAEQVQMDEAQADKILEANAGSPLRLDKLVQFLSSLSNEPLSKSLSASLTVLKLGVEAIALFLAGAHADAILINDLGMLVSSPDIHTCGASERLYYCGRKQGLNLPACTAGNVGHQCQSCARLQERSHRLLLRQYAPEHVSRVCENENFLTECCDALNKVMKTWQSSPGIQARGCFAIFNLACLDNAKVIACGTWFTITRVITFGLHHWNEHVLSCALRALHRLLDSTDGASGDMQDFVECNTVAASNVISGIETEQVRRLIEDIVETLVVHRLNENLQMLGIRCLHILSSVPQILETVAKAGGGIGVEVIIRAMLDNLENINTDVGVCLQRLCCSALLHICRDTSANLLLVAIGCVSTLAKVIEKYPTDVAALVMRLLTEICRNLPKEDNFPKRLEMATHMRQVCEILHDKKLADARPYALMCEIIYILADGSKDICHEMLSNGAKDAVEGAKNMHADHDVQEWADNCLRVLHLDLAGNGIEAAGAESPAKGLGLAQHNLYDNAIADAGTVSFAGVLDPPAAASAPPPPPLTIPAPPVKQSACCEVQ